MIDKKRERDNLRVELKPDIDGVAKKIEKSVAEKSFIIDKRKEQDKERVSIKTDIKEIGEKLESAIEKIEQKKKFGDVTPESQPAKTDMEKWLAQIQKFRKSV
ncbi:MAG: hypothetical protein ACTSQD_04765 [Promethearchaeota archaeon]